GAGRAGGPGGELGTDRARAPPRERDPRARGRGHRPGDRVWAASPPRLPGPANLPRLDAIGLDPTALLFTFVTSVLACLLLGLLPVVKYAAPHVATGLRSSGRSSSASRERHRARSSLVVVQVALALVLLVGSGLMVRSFRALRGGPPRFPR